MQMMMTGQKPDGTLGLLQVSASGHMASARLRHLGHQRMSSNGAALATIPAGTTLVTITAETATTRFAINGAADANSTPVGTGAIRTIGPLDNLTSLGIFNASSSIAHIDYFCEA